MSGIAGIWNLDGRPLERALLGRLSETLAHRGSGEQGLWLEDAVGLACQLRRVTPESLREAQPLVHGSGAALVFDGRLDNREELLTILGGPGISADSPDPALVLAAYEAFGVAFVERLVGDFALGLFDPRRSTLVLARDAIGVRPLYYCRKSDTFLFASEVTALLAHPEVTTRPNEDVLAALLVDGDDQGFDGRTVFEGVYSLPPAHMGVLTPLGLATRRYWDFEPERPHLGSFAESAEAFRDHLERAVRRRCRSAYPVAVFASGGLDSSAVLCIAEALRRRDLERHPPILGIALTSARGFTSRESDEARFLLEIEGRYGITIERVPFNTVGFVSGLRQAICQIEAPFLDTEWPGRDIYRFLNSARERGARVLLTGDWIEQMLGGQAYLVDLFRRLAWGQVRAHLREMGRWSNDTTPGVYVRQFFRDLVRYHVPDRLVPWLRRLDAGRRRPRADRPPYREAFQQRARSQGPGPTRRGGGFASAHARSVYRYVRSPYNSLFLEASNKRGSAQGVDIACPFLDRDLVSFLMGTAGEILAWQGVPKAILREAVAGTVPDPIVRREWKTDHAGFVDEGMEGDYPQLKGVLDRGGMAVRWGYMDARGMEDARRELEEWVRARSVIPLRLRGLVALELWLQVFFGAPRSEPRGVASAIPDPAVVTGPRD